MREISDPDLSIADVPGAESDWETIGNFGLTFNGYRVWGSFEKCAEIANAQRHGSLAELRTCLFFEQRRWRHFGEVPDEESMAYIRGVVQQIRDTLTIRDGQMGSTQVVDGYGKAMQDAEAILRILGKAKKLAQQYRKLTGKPLGITGEVAEYEAACILGVTLTPARQAGYDAVETIDGTSRRLQIKGRCLLDNRKPSQRLGSINIEKDWDAVLMVLLNENFDAIEIYEAERAAVVAALTDPGSKARNERGALAISKFKSIGRLRWAKINT